MTRGTKGQEQERAEQQAKRLIERIGGAVSKEQEHVLQLESRFTERGVKAVCCCGWEGPHRDDSKQAAVDYTDHVVDAVVKEAS